MEIQVYFYFFQVEGVAQAVYKRRKDIQRFSGAEVAETGIGIGEDSLPVESTDRDWIFMPVLFICAFTITALLSVLAVIKVADLH